MAKRLNPKRRRELWERQMTTLTRPSTLTTEGSMRLNAGQHVRAGTISGSSAGLARGLLHDEADLKQYAKPKRRKAVKQGVHVNQADLVGHLHRPVKEPVGAEYPTPKPQRRVGRKIMTVSKKVWSNQ